MTTQSLTEQIRHKASFLCIGLDSDMALLPEVLRKHSQEQFLYKKENIESNQDYEVD